MSDVMGQQKSELEIGQGFDNNALSDTEIADYLLSHPDFFIKHAHLLEDLTIPHTLKGSVSLVELQSEQLRKKVRLLNYKLNQLISIARQNEQIYRVYADLNLRLLAAESMEELELILEEIMQERLKLESVVIKPFVGANAFPEIQRRLFIEKRFRRDKFFFGRLSEHERKLLFSDQEANSVALLLLGDLGELGMLAVSSKDASHFNPDMDTLLITQLQQFLSILIPKLLKY
ncbi:MAG: DUF484 family protein [Paraglaciecola sp.]|uniref:DUF484 family protein n=1 Tax=Pseudomonadati TaxID=3379134 RepID=UPI00273E7D15|nr:DUF484 family protein [Paraglaciecola sp.]MDP5031544.1 DUF484 family protein [Paraglaciecola sp.]MDP5132551.1 DUF484 family protein [Paraglaciecola sp.]